MLHRYCRGLDRMDRAMAESVWHPGGTADYGPMFQGTGTGFLDWVWGAHEGLARHSHMVGNALIDVDVAAGTAVSETYISVWLRTFPHDGVVTDLFGRGRYVDRWSRSRRHLGHRPPPLRRRPPAGRRRARRPR